MLIDTPRALFISSVTSRFRTAFCWPDRYPERITSDPVLPMASGTGSSTGGKRAGKQIVARTFLKRRRVDQSQAGRAKRAAENGLPPETALQHHETAKPATRPLKPKQFSDYRTICKRFREYAGGLPGGSFELDGTLCNELPDAIAAHRPAWSRDQLTDFAIFLAKSVKLNPRDHKRGIGRVDALMSALNRSYFRVNGCGFKRKTIESILAEIGKRPELLFRIGRLERAQLTVGSLKGMVRTTAILDSSIRWSPRRRLDMTLLIALLSGTGVRGAAILRYGTDFSPETAVKYADILTMDVVHATAYAPDGVATDRPDDDAFDVPLPPMQPRSEGIQWSDFRFYKTANGVKVWMRSKDRKTGLSEGHWYSLVDGPIIGLCAAKLACIAAWLDGVFGTTALEQVFDCRVLQGERVQIIQVDAEA